MTRCVDIKDLQSRLSLPTPDWATVGGGVITSLIGFSWPSW